ncbi:MAG: type II toxin-antitoxin system PemK/MazF family toxin [Phycisphaerales bacterium]
MTDGNPELRLGCIVWASVADPRGRVKSNPRPLVVVTPTDEIILDEPFVAAAVTTTFARPLTPESIELPWSPYGHPATRLKRECVVQCNWLVRIRASDVGEIKGYVPGRTLNKILARIAELTHE